jgi:hypothetical protein
MTRARPLTSAVLLTVLLLAGCTGGGEPAASPTPDVSSGPATSSPPPSETPSPSPSPTEVVEPPERPAALDDPGLEGAKAAAEYFALLDTYIMKTGDTAVYEQMSHPMCETCTARLDQAQEIARNGDIFTGGDTRAKVVHAYEQDNSTGIWPLDVEEDTTAVVITDSEGREVATFERYSDRSRYEVFRGDDAWYIIGIVGLD